jgi:hypothetical protein
MSRKLQNSLPLHGTIPQTMPPTAAPIPISSIPPHLQSSMYRTTTTPPPYLGSGAIPPSSALAASSSLASSAPTHTPTPPYGYANGQASSTGGYGAYGQQRYGLYQQQQQQQQQQQYQQYPQGGSYAGYSGYAAQPVQPVAAPAFVLPALPDALSGIPEEQNVGFVFALYFVHGLLFAFFFPSLFPDICVIFFATLPLSNSAIKRVSNPTSFLLFYLFII